MKPIVSVKYTMTKKDYSNFYKIVTFKKNIFKTLAIFLFTLAVSIVSNMEELTNIKNIFKNWAIFSLVIIISILVKIKFKVNQVYQLDSNHNSDNHIMIDFFEDKIRIYLGNKNTYNDLSYEDIFKVYESKEYFLVYPNKSQVSVIKKDVLEDPSKLKDLLKNKCPDRYKNI